MHVFCICLFAFLSENKMATVFSKKEPFEIVQCMETYFMPKPPDCCFYSEDGFEIPVHKELLCQTEFMCKLVQSFDCCCKIEIIFSSLSKNELELVVQFLYNGQISCSDKTTSIQVISNLKEILGFPELLNDCCEIQPSDEGFDYLENNIKEEIEFEPSKVEEAIDPLQNYYETETESSEWLMEYDNEVPEGFEEEYNIEENKDFVSQKLTKSDDSMIDKKVPLKDFDEQSSNQCEILEVYSVCPQSSLKTDKSQKGDRQSKIQILKKSEESKETLIRHCRPFTCPECNRKYSKIILLRQHLRKYHQWSKEDYKKMKHKCSFCKVVKWKKSDLEAHIANIHNKNKTYNCSICGKAYKSDTGLRKHIRYDHEGKKKLHLMPKFKCPICEQICRSQPYLDKHISKYCS